MAPKKEVRVAIVGAGLAGMTLAIELRKRLGIESFTIYEKMTDVGGTWRDNYYPGCACDVPSHWYSLSTELNPNWSHKFSSQPEIQAYWKSIWHKHHLSTHTLFDHTFISAHWDEPSQSYNCIFRSTANPDKDILVQCDVLVSCIGGFSTPLDKPHGMKGIERFEGERFHSARWRHDIELKGKRVGVIGNGCSATQFIPIITEDKSTHVLNFSRSPSWFMPRPQSRYSSTTKSIFKYVPWAMRSYRNFIAMTSDVRYIVWIMQMAGLRHYVEEVATKYIKDTAPEKYHKFLIPQYAFGCKRVIMDPGYLAALHRSNLDLVTDPIDTVTEKGILGKSGKEYEFDVLILGTGFDVSEVGLGINVTGRNRKTVTEQWAEQGGPQAYLGTALSNYPNFYTILGPNVATGTASVVYSTESQVNYIVKMIEPMVKSGVTSFMCKPSAEQAYNAKLQASLENTVWKNGGCTSYYKLGNKVVATYPGTLTQFWWATRTPIWEDYVQMGGKHRIAVQHRLGQLGKLLGLVALYFFVKRVGTKKIKQELTIFLLMRYQDLLGLREKIQSIRA